MVKNTNLIRLRAGKRHIILGTDSSIVIIRLRNALENNKHNRKQLEEKILDFIVEELKYLGWKVVYNYQYAENSNCKCDFDVKLESNGFEIYFRELKLGYLIRYWNKLPK